MRSDGRNILLWFGGPWCVRHSWVVWCGVRVHFSRIHPLFSGWIVDYANARLNRCHQSPLPGRFAIEKSTTGPNDCGYAFLWYEKSVFFFFFLSFLHELSILYFVSLKTFICVASVFRYINLSFTAAWKLCHCFFSFLHLPIQCCIKIHSSVSILFVRRDRNKFRRRTKKKHSMNRFKPAFTGTFPSFLRSAEIQWIFITNEYN